MIEETVQGAPTDLAGRALDLWIRRLLRHSRLDAEDIALIRGLPGKLEDYRSTRDIVKLGQRTTHSCLIAAGYVGRFGQTSDGLRQFSALYIPGDMGDLHSAVLPRVSAPLQSMMSATIYSVPHEAILAIGAQSDALARAFWRDCVIDAQVTSEWMLNLGRRDAPSRVAHLLCELACRHAAIGADRDDFPFELTQVHIADATGLTAVHVNRTLRILREAGAVDIRNARATVLDWPLLCRLGDFDPFYLHLAEVER